MRSDSPRSSPSRVHCRPRPRSAGRSPAPGSAGSRERRCDREVAQRVRRGRGRRRRARDARVDVDELRAERAAERLRQVAGPQAEGDGVAGIEDLEPLDVEGARAEAGEGRIRVVPGAAIVPVRIGGVGQRSGQDVEEDVRRAWAVPPLGLTATTFRTLVPPVIPTSTLNEPSPPAVVETTVVAEFASVFVAATWTAFPGAVVPVTVTGEEVTDALSAGLVTVSGVVPACWRRSAYGSPPEARRSGPWRGRASLTNEAADQVSGGGGRLRRRSRSRSTQPSGRYRRDAARSGSSQFCSGIRPTPKKTGSWRAAARPPPPRRP